MRIITHEEYLKLKSVRCDKGKHKFRENNFGVTWCTICGLLAKDCATKLTEEDKLLIVKDKTASDEIK